MKNVQTIFTSTTMNAMQCQVYNALGIWPSPDLHLQACPGVNQELTNS